LRLFLVLAEELHFGRAAARPVHDQPAFSQQIRALESRLGIALVERTSRTVALTAAGAALLPEARATIEAMDRLRQLADVHTREVRGHLTLGSIGAEAAMPYTQAILTGRAVDAAFLRPPVPPVIQTLHLATEARVVCLPADDPLTAQQPLTLAQLAGRPIADVPPGAPRLWWDFWTVNPRPDGTPICFGPMVTDIEARLLTVARGQAITFLPAAARDLYPRPGVAYADVTDLPPCTAALAWLPENRDRPAIAALRNAAHRVTRRQVSPVADALAAGDAGAAAV